MVVVVSLGIMGTTRLVVSCGWRVLYKKKSESKKKEKELREPKKIKQVRSTAFVKDGIDLFDIENRNSAGK